MQCRQLVCAARHDMHFMCFRYIVSCRLNSIDGLCGLRRGSVRLVGRRLCVMCVRLLLWLGCIKLHGVCFGKFLQHHGNGAMQCRQLVCGARDDMHFLCCGQLVSCRLDSIDNLCGLRRGSVLFVGRTVRGVRLRLLLWVGRSKLHGVRFG